MYTGIQGPSMIKKLERNLISVVIPARNEEKRISKCLDSILGSTHKKFEIIVVNDGSTDRTGEIVERYIKKHPGKIGILNYEGEGHGCAFPRNRGAEIARGDILFFFDADDCMREDTLENIIKAFQKYKGVNFIVGDRRIFIPKNWRKIFVYYGMRGKRNLGFLASKKFVMPTKESISITGAYPYIMKTKEFFRIGKHNENLFYNEDLEFNLRLQERKIPKLISKNIIYYNDMGDRSSDFKKRCFHTAKTNLQHRFKMIGISLQTLIFFMAFTLFYPLASFIFLLKTENILVGLFSPFIWALRRVFVIYHFIILFLK
jgi:glycosyltransferase involved in cell wall biosynthesis